MLKEKLKEFFSNEELSTELLECQTNEEAKKLLSEHGVDVTDEEMGILKDYINKFVENNGKLSEKELDEISGGWSVSGIVSTPLRVFCETVGAIMYAPGEGLKRATLRSKYRMNEIKKEYNIDE
jgi:hypothetical protein